MIFDKQHYPEIYRKSRQSHQSKPPTYDKHKNRNENKVEYFHYKIHNTVCHKVGKRIYVVYYSGEDFSVRTAVIEIKRQHLHMLEQILAYIVNDILPDIGHHNRTLFRKQNAYNYAKQNRSAAYQKHWNIRLAAHIIINGVLNNKR